MLENFNSFNNDNELFEYIMNNLELYFNFQMGYFAYYIPDDDMSVFAYNYYTDTMFVNVDKYKMLSNIKLKDYFKYKINNMSNGGIRKDILINIIF
ncbi:hypothetical protein M0Q50_02175 [bacterium]|jgi:hypothetical protein|nr:hypothetical protein [bacterium]